MRTSSDLKDLTDNSLRILLIIISAILISITILITAKLYQNKNTSTPEDKSGVILELEANNFPTLQLGHYALWNLDQDGNYHFLKRFNSLNHKLISLDGTTLTRLQLENPITSASLNTLVVTIEQEGDRDEKPNNLEFMRGKIEGKETTLKFDINIDPNDKNSFILATPTDGNLSINELSGIWFINEKLQDPTLSIPELKNIPFTYQARVVNTDTGTNLTIGNFVDPTSPDNFQNYSSDSLGFNTPGEDFLRNISGELEPPLNLANGYYKVIVSVEPYYQENDFTGEGIFSEILSTNIPYGLAPHTSHYLNQTFEPITLTINMNE